MKEKIYGKSISINVWSAVIKLWLVDDK
jgi:hypothetical protein